VGFGRACEVFTFHANPSSHLALLNVIKVTARVAKGMRPNFEKLPYSWVHNRAASLKRLDEGQAARC
jgi:hypothetical protein